MSDKLEREYGVLVAKSLRTDLYFDQRSRLADFMVLWLHGHTNDARYNAFKGEVTNGWAKIHDRYFDAMYKAKYWTWDNQDMWQIATIVNRIENAKWLVVRDARQKGEMGFQNGLITAKGAQLQALLDWTLARDRMIFVRNAKRSLGEWDDQIEHTDLLRTSLVGSLGRVRVQERQ